MVFTAAGAVVWKRNAWMHNKSYLSFHLDASEKLKMESFKKCFLPTSVLFFADFLCQCSFELHLLLLALRQGSQSEGTHFATDWAFKTGYLLRSSVVRKWKSHSYPEQRMLISSHHYLTNQCARGVDWWSTWLMIRSNFKHFCDYWNHVFTACNLQSHLNDQIHVVE